MEIEIGYFWLKHRRCAAKLTRLRICPQKLETWFLIWSEPALLTVVEKEATETTNIPRVDASLFPGNLVMTQNLTRCVR